MFTTSPWSWKPMISAVISFVFPLVVHAQGSSCDSGGDGSEALRSCKKFSCQARQACDAAAKATSSKNDAEAAQLQNQYNGKSQVSSSAHDLSGLGSRSAGSLGQAANYCRSFAGSGAGASGAKTCQSMCDPNKISQSAPRAQSERQEMERERQSCLSAINQNAESLDQGKKDNENANKDAKKTEDQAKSEGGKGGGDKGEGDKGQGDKGQGDEGKGQSDNKSAAQSNDPTQQNCDSPGAATLASCSTKLESECTGEKIKTDPRCKTFADQYCGSGFSGPQASGTLKKGSGASSDFCRQRMASNFCNSPGRSNCPSCNGTAQSITSASGARLAQICGACASGADIDPIFSDPQVASACKSSMNTASIEDGAFSPSSHGRSDSSAGGSGGGSGAHGGGGGGGLGASGTSASLGSMGEPSEETATSQLKTDIGGGESGGAGGGFSYGGSGGNSSGDHDLNSQSASGGDGLGRGIASDGEFSPASDVMKSVGPNVFSIQSAVIRNRCESGRLLHCEKGKR